LDSRVRYPGAALIVRERGPGGDGALVGMRGVAVRDVIDGMMAVGDPEHSSTADHLHKDIQ
jgi:hypothetical protein